MPPLATVKENGKVSQEKAVKIGLNNAKSIGVRISPEKDQYAIENAYTKRKIILGKKALSHSLDASKIHRLRTNARLSAIGASIVQNAVPINGLKKETRQANGTYAMACLVKDEKGYVVAIVTINEFDSTVVGIDTIDNAHSINGRFLAKKEDSRSSSRELELGQASLSTTAISTIKITDFLKIVNSTHRSILSDDVLRHFDEVRPSDGHYAKRVLFQKKQNQDYIHQQKPDYWQMQSAQESLAQYENGEISRDDFFRQLFDQERVMNPREIANLTTRDVLTTPPLPRQEGTPIGNGDSKFAESIQKSSIFDATFKAEAAADDFINKYQEVTNKETLKQAAAELDEGGAKYVNKWFAKPAKECTLIDEAVGFILMDRYQRVGDYDSAMAVAEKVRAIGTDTAQKLQLFSIIGRFDPIMGKARCVQNNRCVK